jgi:hypothetical protein
MSQAIVVLVRTGVASPRGLRFVPGTRVRDFSVGLEGTWRVDAPGMTGLAAHLEFDGASIRVSAGLGADVRIDGQPIGPMAVVVVPPVVVSIGSARLLVDHDDRSDDVVPGESLLAGTTVEDPPVTRLWPIEALLAERRDEAAENAFFESAKDTTEQKRDPRPAPDFQCAATELHDLHGLGDAEDVRLSRRTKRLRWRAALAVVGLPLMLVAAGLLIRAARLASAAAPVPSSSIATPVGSTGPGEARPETRPADSSPASSASAPAAAPKGPGNAVPVSGPVLAHPSVADHASAERAAVDLVATGDYARAARAYDDLASSRAGTPMATTFREAARILRSKAPGAGAP